MSKKFVLGALFIGMVASLACLRLDRFLTLEQFHTNKVAITGFVATHPWLAATLLAVTYVVMIAFAIPTGGLITIAGGYFLGIAITTIAVVVGATIGATLSFWSGRYLWRTVIEQRYADRVTRLNHELVHYGTSYLLTVRLVPFMPFFLINLILGLTRISTTTFVWTTAVGITPGTALYAYAGTSLAHITSVQELWSWQAVMALVILAMLAAVPLVMRVRK